MATPRLSVFLPTRRGSNGSSEARNFPVVLRMGVDHAARSEPGTPSMVPWGMGCSVFCQMYASPVAGEVSASPKPTCFIKSIADGVRVRNASADSSSDVIPANGDA